MQKKNVLIIILTVLVFLSVACLGVMSVFRINFVTVNAPVISTEAKDEAAQLQKKLYDAYEGENIFSADETIASEIFEQFPYFKMTSFVKEYPNRIIIKATEDVELFAVKKDENTYYILGADGTLLGERNSPVNRSDNANNIMVTGVEIKAQVGEVAKNDECLNWLYSFCNKTSELLGGIRKNVTAIEILRPTASATEMMFKIHFKEGVVAYVRNPAAFTQNKAEKLVEKYVSLSDSQRLRGMIVLTDNTQNVIVDYSQDDLFAS